MTDRDKRNIKEMMQWCRVKKVLSFADLCDYAVKFRHGWFDTLVYGGYSFMIEYLKSLQSKQDQS